MALATLLSTSPTFAATADPDASAGDLCGHVQTPAARALIASPDDSAFTVESIQNEPGKLTCVWTAQKAGAPGATLTVDLYHLATVARARSQLRGFGAAAHAPQMAPTDSADDEIVQVSPVMAAARHGVEIAVARVAAPPALSDRPDWKARFEALALAGSGARLTAPLETSAPSSAPAPAPRAWRPPDRPLPANSAVFTPIVHVMWRLTHWRFEFVAAAMLASFAIGAVAIGLRRFVLLGLIPPIVGYAFANLIDGPDWVGGLIYRFGAQAQATITGGFQTNDVYNDQNVVGYNVLIRPAGGPVVETKFRSDDFNVYPPRNATRYPDQGDIFTVRYLRGFPDDFVIVRDDGSPWSRRLRCEDLAGKAGQADRKTGFAPEDPAFRQAAQAARAALQSAGCQADSGAD